MADASNLRYAWSSSVASTNGGSGPAPAATRRSDSADNSDAVGSAALARGRAGSDSGAGTGLTNAAATTTERGGFDAIPELGFTDADVPLVSQQNKTSAGGAASAGTASKPAPAAKRSAVAKRAGGAVTGGASPIVAERAMQRASGGAASGVRTTKNAVRGEASRSRPQTEMSSTTAFSENEDDDWVQFETHEPQAAAASEGAGAGVGGAAGAAGAPSGAASAGAAVDVAAQRGAKTHAKREMKKLSNYAVKNDAYWRERVIKQHGDYGWLYIFCIGVSTPIGAIYTTWGNTMPLSGTVSGVLGISAVAFGFVTLCCCLGEMASTFPFAGGSYGFARALLGKEAGQLVGLAESLEWLLSGAGFILLVVDGMGTIFGTDQMYSGVYLLAAYGLSLFLNLMNGKWLYIPFAINTIVGIAFLLIYQFGMMHYADWNANAPFAAGLLADDGVTPVPTWFLNGFAGFMQALPYGIFTLLGFEICPLICDEVVEPKVAVPKGMVRSAIVTCGLAACTVLAGVAAPQRAFGNLAVTPFPLSDGYAYIFSGGTLTGIGADDRIAILLPVFTQWTAFICCNMAWGRQMFAMARSGLLPHWLSQTWQRRSTPAAALITGSIISLGVSLLVSYCGADYNVLANGILFNVAIAGCCINYIFQAVCYLVLRYRYAALARPFKSPLGLFGAYYTLIIFSLSLIGICWYNYLWQSLLVLFGWIGLGMLYYGVYARFHLLMSPEEYRAMFVLYSIQFIRMKQQRAISGAAHGGNVASSPVTGAPSKKLATSGPQPSRAGLLDASGKAGALSRSRAPSTGVGSRAGGATVAASEKGSFKKEPLADVVSDVVQPFSSTPDAPNGTGNGSGGGANAGAGGAGRLAAKTLIEPDATTDVALDATTPKSSQPNRWTGGGRPRPTRSSGNAAAGGFVSTRGARSPSPGPAQSPVSLGSMESPSDMLLMTRGASSSVADFGATTSLEESPPAGQRTMIRSTGNVVVEELDL